MMATSKLQANDSLLEEACFTKANHLITACHLHIPKVASLCDMNSKLFIELFTAICEFPLPDLIHHPTTLEDEAHNLQMIIDTLSLDILEISMSYISGEDIAAGSILSIYNLLEILEGFMSYCSRFQEVKAISGGENCSNKNIDDNVKLILVCTVCGYRKKIDEFVPLRAQNFTFSCPVCQCPVSLEENSKCASIKSSNNYKFYNSSGESILMPSYQYTNLITYQSEDGLLAESNAETSCSSSLIPRPTIVQNEKLRPDFARVGVRDLDFFEQTDPKTTAATSNTDFFKLTPTFATSENYSSMVPEISSEMQKSSKNTLETSLLTHSSSSASLAIDTVIFKDKLKKVHSSNEIYRRLQSEKPVCDAKIFQQLASPKRKLSKSMDDILHMKKDQIVQTSDSLLIGITAKSNARKQTCIQKSSDFNENREDNQHHQYNIRVNKYEQNYQQSMKSPKRKPATPYPKSFASLRPWNYQRRSASSSPPAKHHNNFPSSPRRRYSRSISPPKKRCTQPNSDWDSHCIKESNSKKRSSLKAETLVREILEGLIAVRESLKDNPLKKSQTRLQVEEADRRQRILSNILQKEIHRSHRSHRAGDVRKHSKSVRQKQNKENIVIDSALFERCWNDLYHEIQKKEQNKTSQNQRGTKCSLDSATWNKVHDLLNEWQEESRNATCCNDLDDLENYYKNQFISLAESVAIEKRDIQDRKKAQQRVLKMMKNQFRHKKKKEG